MSHFYGTLQGSRGQATRCGTKNSGITTYAAGWQGAIRVYVYQDEQGRDKFTVNLVPWKYSGGQDCVIAEGLLDASEHDMTLYGPESYEAA